MDTIVLAGGSSTRYTSNKLLQDIDGKPLLYHTIKPFYNVSSTIIIVTGAYDVPDSIVMDFAPKLSIVHNENHLDGMFTSVLTGVRHCHSDVMIIPGDMPLVNTTTLQIIKQELGDIRVPVYQDKRGHPIYLSRQMVSLLQEEPPQSNLKAFRDRHEVHYITVDDPGVLIDIDTQQEFHQYVTERTLTDED